MTSLWRATRGRPSEHRDISTIEDYALALQESLGYSGYSPLAVQQSMPGQVAEKAPSDLPGYAMKFATNPVIWACMVARQSVFSATRFQWQRLNQGRPSEMFGSTDLRLLEEPWTGGTTQDLLARVIQDADLAGNSYWTVVEDELVRLRPDWVYIVLEPREFRGGTLGWKKLGYVYQEPSGEPVPLLVDEVAHFAPVPDPLASYRGMSWLTPVIRETINDDLMSSHKRRFMENAATPNLVVRLAREVSPEAFEKFKAKMDATHKGAANAYKTMYLGGGADVSVVGKDFQQLDFSKVQGAGETRIAAAAGVPPIIVGLSEGLQAATYSNYGQARRRFADGTIHPLWQNVAGSFQRLVTPPGGGGSGAVRLWYDARDVPFLREDKKDATEIQGIQSRTIRTLLDAGYTAESVVPAVLSEDWGLLAHSGLFSVQLQEPGGTGPPTEPTPPEEGT
ncbi:phage portal protein [Streptomyces wuyuanensis]|uniref:Phage portal protein BeeE n=1 Tax=Streptomyces wuyuanensis TaxID=1196353 RepID=A0A1G9Z8R3_9ACTN|nr:phage portal protein [Streptomyces wuyuanensis]SDN17948.1 Phage portal protein BeeE [Streptomyces wuyuanensis]